MENETEKKLSGFISEKLKDKKTARIVVIIGLIGILLIFISTFFSNNGKEKAAVNDASSVVDYNTEYRASLEKDLKEMIIRMTGNSDVKVLVTLESGTQYIYANQQKQTTDTTEDKQGESRYKIDKNDQLDQKQTIINTSGGEEALKVTELAPKVKGVVVVCSGGGDPVLKERITDAVKTALDITAKRVFVSPVPVS